MALLGDGRRAGDQRGLLQDPLAFNSASIPILQRAPVIDRFLAWRTADEAARATWKRTDISRPTTTRDAFVVHSYGAENLFERLWYEPEIINVGFIVEATEHDIRIWNAYFTQQVTWSAIAVTNPEGTQIDHAPLPIDLPAFGDYTATVTVLQDGPPTQNTVYRLTIESVDYTTTITGIRVNPWPFEPNYEDKITFEMSFETALARNRYFEEQRRPLRDKAFRTMRLKGWAQNIDAQKMKQLIAFGHDKVFGIPIYSEPCYPTGTLQGSSIINTTNDLTKHWNLNNLVDFVILVDHLTLDAEIKEVTSVGATSITLVNNIDTAFVVGRTVVYPMFVAVLDQFTITDEADSVQGADVVFEEFVIG